MKAIAYQLPDGSLLIGRICLPDGSFTKAIQDMINDGFSEDEAIIAAGNAAIAASTAAGAGQELAGAIAGVFDSEHLPDGKADGSFDATFQGAFKLSESGVEICMTKASEIKKDMLRAERAPLLSKLDVESSRNIEQALDNSPVLAEKQRLRDITKLVDSVTSIAELKAISI